MAKKILKQSVSNIKRDSFVLAVRFIEYLILLDLGARPLRGREGPRPPCGLSRSRCLEVVQRVRINILRLTIPLIVSNDATEINRLSDMAEALLSEFEKTSIIDIHLLLKEGQEREAEWGKILQLFVEGKIKPDDILAKR